LLLRCSVLKNKVPFLSSGHIFGGVYSKMYELCGGISTVQIFIQQIIFLQQTVHGEVTSCFVEIQPVRNGKHAEFRFARCVDRKETKIRAAK
jgi:hypothetical protein